MIHAVPGNGGTESVMVGFITVPVWQQRHSRKEIIMQHVGAKIEICTKYHGDIIEEDFTGRERVGRGSQRKFLEEIIPEKT